MPLPIVEEGMNLLRRLALLKCMQVLRKCEARLAQRWTWSKLGPAGLEGGPPTIKRMSKGTQQRQSDTRKITAERERRLGAGMDGAGA
jgi:hypothetical protein